MTIVKRPSSLHIRVMVVLAAMAGLVLSCQKELDYSRPPDANTFEGDKITAFKNLTADTNAIWAWDMPVNLLGLNYPCIFFQFFEDSTADIYAIVRAGVIDEVKVLTASNTLSEGDAANAAELISFFDGFTDATVRRLLNSPAFSDFREMALGLLPNYEGFSALVISEEEEGGLFDMNGPVQLSLTFHNSELLASLKEDGALDFDFRIMKSTEDSTVLDGYYSNNENRQSVLYKTSPLNFIAASNAIIAANPVTAAFSLRSEGRIIPPPAGYNSGINFFYSAFNQSFDRSAGYGFISNGAVTENMPEIFKSAKIVTVKSVRSGSPLNVPSGTVMVTLTVVNTDGTATDVELVKD